MRLPTRSQAILFAVFCWLLAPAAAWSENIQIRDIRVEGLQRISPGTVFNYLPVKPGDTLETTQTGEIIRSLYKTGFFKDVRLELEDGVLLILVTERPSISEINFSGNESLETEQLLEGLKAIGMSAGRTFKRSVLDTIERELRRQYFNEGKYGIRLESTVTPLERNRVAINITIDEGRTARIRQINIIGNEVFNDSELLDQFQLGPGKWWSLFGSEDQYSRQKLSGDLESLRSYYLDRGYIKFRINSTQVEISPDRQDIYVTINISEGDVFTIKDIKLAGEMVSPAQELFPLIHLRRGEPFSRKKVVESSDRISQKLSDLGYAFANVNSIPEVDEQEKTVAITYFVDPGKRAYVRRINISGNRSTRDRVIRRELRQLESAWFSSEKLKLSKQRLQRLGFFEDVNVETPAVPGSPDEVDVNVDVTEKPSGAFLAGIGFSQSTGISFNTSISEDNFLGSGKRVALAFNNSSVNTEYTVSYTNPYYTVDGISRGFNLSYKATDLSQLESTATYSTDTGIIGVNFGIPLSEFNRFNFGLDFEHITFKQGTTPSTEVTDFIEYYDGTGATSSRFLDFKLNLSWRHDSRNSALFATSGAVQRLGLEVTVPGSDLEFYKLYYSHRRYFPLTKSLTFSANGEIGYGDGYGSTPALPLFENFFGGGPKSVRGFKASSLGPLDSTGLALGGNLLVVGNFELLFPPPVDIDALRLSLFVDVGNVYDTKTSDVDVNDLRVSTGFGASWLSPIGALTISFATPLTDHARDQTEFFQFSLGTTF